MCWSILVNQLKRLLDSKLLRWSLGANQLWCPKSGLTDLTVLTIGSAPSKQWRSAPEAFRVGHYKDLTQTGNRARKVSGTHGNDWSYHVGNLLQLIRITTQIWVVTGH